MKHHRIIILILGVILLSYFFTPGYTTKITQDKVEIYLSNKNIAQFKVYIHYSEITTKTLDYLFLGNMYGLKGMFNNKPINCTIKNVEIGSEAICKQNNRTKNGTLTLSFYSKDVIRRINDVNEITYIKPILKPISNLYVTIYLPEGSVLMTLNNMRSFSPENAIIGSDSAGRRIVIRWNMKDVELGKKYVFTAYYESVIKQEKENNKITYILLSVIGALFILLAISGYFLHKRKTNQKIIEVLIDDEKKVLDIIKKLGDGCKQKDIVKESGFSKAKVSRIIENLKKRKIIRTERVGRTNKVYLEVK